MKFKDFKPKFRCVVCSELIDLDGKGMPVAHKCPPRVEAAVNRYYGDFPRERVRTLNQRLTDGFDMLQEDDDETNPLPPGCSPYDQR